MEMVRSGWILPGVMISKVTLLSSMLPGRPSMRTRSKTGHGNPLAQSVMSAACHSPVLCATGLVRGSTLKAALPVHMAGKSISFVSGRIPRAI